MNNLQSLSQYNPEGSDLRIMQLRMLDMLSYIDSVCEKHNIKYWLSAGSLLGAVRHGGFIPWDDDLDIEMLRRDYKKLLKVLKNELPEKYVLQTHKTDSFYVASYAKLRETNSLVVEGNGRDNNYKFKGIYVDIFPIEKSNYKLMEYTGLLHLYLLFNICGKSEDKFGILKLIVKFNYLLINGLYSLLRLFYVFSSKKKYFLPFGSSFTKSREEKCLFPLRKIMFEGREFYCPNDTDSYLRSLYGEYNTLPPIECRSTHLLSVKFF